MMKNFNIRYECLDARDHFRAQLKKGAATDLFGSWEKMDAEDDDCGGRDDMNGPSIEFDDSPSDPLGLGQKQIRQMREMEMVNDMLTATGWTDPILGKAEQQPTFRPNKIFSGKGWEQEVDREKQRILEKKMNTMHLGTLPLPMNKWPCRKVWCECPMSSKLLINHTLRRSSVLTAYLMLLMTSSRDFP